MYEAPYFKKLTIELSTGETIEVDGALIQEIEWSRAFTGDPLGDRFYGRGSIVGPEELTIKFLIFGQAWSRWKAKQQEQEYLDSPKKRLPFVPKVLPEHKE